jgi:hypothetical protein
MKQRTLRKNRHRRMIAAVSFVLLAAVSSVVWAGLTFMDPHKVAQLTAGSSMALSFSADNLGADLMIGSTSGPSCDGTVSIGGNTFAVSNPQFSAGIKQCVYTMTAVPLVGSPRITASFMIISGGPTLTGSSTQGNGTITLGNGQSPVTINIRNGSTSSLTSMDLGFSNGDGTFLLGSACVGGATATPFCRHDFGALPLAVNDSYNVQVSCVPAATQQTALFLVAGTPASHMDINGGSPMKFVCSGLAPGNISVAPSSFTFSAPIGGMMTDSRLKLTNSGAGSASVLLTMTGASELQFAGSGSSTSVNVGANNGTANVPIACSPGAAGPFTTTVKSPSFADEVVVTCNGVAAGSIFATPTMLDFGEIRISKSKMLPFTIQRSGVGLPLTLTAPRLSVPDSYTQVTGTPLQTVMTGQVTISAPSSPATFTPIQKVIVVGNATQQVDIPVTATFVDPKANALAADFVVCGNDNAGIDVQLRAEGTGHFTVKTPTLASNAQLQLSATQPTNFPISIVNPNVAAVRLDRKTGIADGEYMTMLNWPTDLGNNDVVSASVRVRYQSTGGAVGPRQLGFERTDIGQRSRSQTVTVSNCDATPKTYDSIVVSQQFDIDSLAGFTLAAGGKKTFTVHYAPTAKGPVLGSIRFTSGGTALEVALNGDTPVEATIDPQSLYACTCTGGSPSQAAPLALALGWIITTRRRRKSVAYSASS